MKLPALKRRLRKWRAGVAGLLLTAATACVAADIAANPAVANRGNTADLPEVVTIRSQVREVHVIFTASDLRRQPVLDLTLDQVQLQQDGEAVQTISDFRRDLDLPLQVALLTDQSDSMQLGLAQEQKAAEEFLARIIRPGVDTYLTLPFATLSVPREPLARPSPGGGTSGRAEGQTALYDALLEASSRLAASPSGNALTRRVIVLLSDGEDNYSLHGLGEVLEAAGRAGIAVYGITAHPPKSPTRGDAVLRQLADGTGGRAFVVKNYADAGAVFLEIEKELRSQYLIAFRPPNRGRCGMHQLQMVPRQSGLTLHWRGGYSDCDP